MESCAAGLPNPGILHRCPRLSRRFRVPFLKELDRDLIWCADKRHVPVPGGTKDGDSHPLQMSACLVDIIHGEREMSEVSTTSVLFRIPVVGELDLRLSGALSLVLDVVPVSGQKDECEPSLFGFFPFDLLHPKSLAKEAEGVFEIGDADHRVEIVHVGVSFLCGGQGVTPDEAASSLFWGTPSFESRVEPANDSGAFRLGSVDDSEEVRHTRAPMSEVENPTVEEKRDEGSPLLTRLLRHFLTVLFGSGSLILGTCSVFVGESPNHFVAGNRVEIGTRLLVLGLSWGGGFLTAAISLFLSHRRDPTGELSRRISYLCAPLIASAFIPVLFEKLAWNHTEIGFLAFLLATCLAVERLFRPAASVVADSWSRAEIRERVAEIANSRWVRWIPLGIVVCLVAGYIYRIGILTNISHVRMTTMSSDLAEYDNLFYNALNGHPFRSPAIAGHLDDWNTLQGHAEFSLYMLLPFYAISPGAHALLWIQTVIVALTAIPIFLLAEARLGRFAGVCFAVVYLFMPAVQQPNFYDFHFTPLGMFYAAWLMFFVAKLAQDPGRRAFRVATYVSLALALLCREDISIGTAVLGTYLVLSGVIVQDGLILAGVSAVYFVSMKFGIMPLFGTWWFDNMYNDLKAEGAKGFGAVILTLISNPSFVLRTMLSEPKLLYVLHMTVPVLALWLRRPLLWMAFLPGLVATLLVTNRPPMYQSTFQYTYLWLPYVMAAAVVATPRGAKGLGTLLGLVLAASALSNQMGAFPRGDSIRGGFSTKTFEVTEEERARYEDLHAIIDMIPPDAAVAATEVEGPHVSNRLVMYSLKYTLGPFPEYLLVGRVGHRGENAHLRTALESQRYGVVAERGIFTLAKLGADPKKNASLWRKVGGRRMPPSGGPGRRSPKKRPSVRE